MLLVNFFFSFEEPPWRGQVGKGEGEAQDIFERSKEE